jgi:hypothetical protein
LDSSGCRSYELETSLTPSLLHESAIIPLVGAIVSLLWVLDDVLCEKKGWKTPGCIADKWLTKNIWFYSKVKEWIEEKAGK